jgi:hypothetical protein
VSGQGQAPALMCTHRGDRSVGLRGPSSRTDLGLWRGRLRLRRTQLPLGGLSGDWGSRRFRQ